MIEKPDTYLHTRFIDRIRQHFGCAQPASTLAQLRTFFPVLMIAAFNLFLFITPKFVSLFKKRKGSSRMQRCKIATPHLLQRRLNWSPFLQPAPTPLLLRRSSAA
jgi:hypothetical protein